MTSFDVSIFSDAPDTTHLRHGVCLQEQVWRHHVRRRGILLGPGQHPWIRFTYPRRVPDIATEFWVSKFFDIWLYNCIPSFNKIFTWAALYLSLHISNLFLSCDFVVTFTWEKHSWATFAFTTIRAKFVIMSYSGIFTTTILVIIKQLVSIQRW